MEGAPIEFQKHTLQFPAAIVDCSYEVLKISMISYFNKSTPFKTVLPFGIYQQLRRDLAGRKMVITAGANTKVPDMYGVGGGGVSGRKTQK